MHSERPSVVVTSSLSPSSLGIVRAFGERGIPTILIDLGDGSPSLRSRHIHTRIAAPPPRKDAAGFIRALMSLAGRLDHRPVLLPTGDWETRLIAKHRHELERGYRFRIAAWPLLGELTDKARFHRLLQKHGMPAPRLLEVVPADRLAQRARHMSLPFLVKPVFSMDFVDRFNQKLFVVRDGQDLQRVASQLSGWDQQILCQELVPVATSYEVSCYLGPGSEPLAVCGWDRLRQMPPAFGSASFCRSRYREEPIRLGLHLLQRLGYVGIAGVELIKDTRDGAYKIIEVNPRSSLQNRLAAACGVDLERMAYEDLTDQQLARPAKQLDGIFWVDNFKDTASILLELLAGRGVGARSRHSGGRQVVHTLASLGDPLPYLAELLLSGPRALKLLWRDR